MKGVYCCSLDLKSVPDFLTHVKNCCASASYSSRTTNFTADAVINTKRAYIMLDLTEVFSYVVQRSKLYKIGTIN